MDNLYGRACQVESIPALIPSQIKMKVIIKTIDGHKKEMTVEPSFTAMKCKTILSETTGIYKEMIRLLFQGQSMDDSKTLAELNVTDGSIIHLIMQLRDA